MANVLIMGATGAVGKHVLQQALRHPSVATVTSLGRREAEYNGPHLAKLENVLVDFENVEQVKERIQNKDVVFCCLGTTRAAAGSAAEFFKVDHDFVLNTARLLPCPATHFLYVSSVGANPHSLFLYPRTKGLVETHLAELGFRRLTIMQPGFLQEAERGHWRVGEWIAGGVVRVLGALSMAERMAVPTRLVARAMVVKALEEKLEGQGSGKVERVGNQEMVQIGKAWKEDGS